MKSYHFKHDFISFTSDCSIVDDNNKLRFRVEGEFLKAGAQLTDVVSGTMLDLRPIRPSFSTHWEVRRETELLATFKGSGWLLPTFKLDIPGPNDYFIEQQMALGIDALVTRPEDGRVARIHQPGLLKGPIQVDIEPEQDELFIIACATILSVLRRGG